MNCPPGTHVTAVNWVQVVVLQRHMDLEHKVRHVVQPTFVMPQGHILVVPDDLVSDTLVK